MERVERSRRKLTSLDYTIAGASAGVCSRCIGQPLDVLKIRFQVQNIKEGSLKYKGIRNSIWMIFKEEGVTAFWKGHVPAQTLSIVYGAAQFSSYEYSKSFFTKLIGNSKNKDPVINFLSGGNAGIVASFATQPLDVIRTRTVMHIHKKGVGMFNLVLSMAKENGIRTFYKGVAPNLLSVYPNCGFNFLFYNVFMNTWNQVKLPNTKMKSLFCGCLSGAVAKVIILPLDNVKKRLQISGSANFVDIRYNGMVDCFRTVLKEQGVKAFYRGVSPSVLKACVVGGTTFFVYEETCIVLNKYRN